ncbi:MAG: hypothetical protein ABI863_19895 [Ginsengibacter sp.]
MNNCNNESLHEEPVSRGAQLIELINGTDTALALVQEARALLNEYGNYMYEEPG